MGVSGVWLPLAILGAGAVSAYFVRYLWPYREEPGARFFIGTIACETLWALSYGAALFVFDPALRWWFEIPIWIGVDFIGVFFLAFALEYTGRGRIVRSKLMGGIVLVQTVHTAVVATNPLHGLAWSGYRIDPAFGAATVSYTHEPWLFANFVGVFLMVSAGSFLLFDTFFSYGPLYRIQAAAVALSPVLPGVAFVLWLFEVGGTAPLNLTPLTFPAHLALDMYAFFRRDMFEVAPAARRASEHAAIDDLGSAVVVVDRRHRTIDLNEEARRVLSVETPDALGRPLDAVLDGIDPSEDGGTVSKITDGRRREYAVTTSPLEDSAGTHVGYTIVLGDVTAERRREQRLAVLNRVLRHNLRNDLNVVRGSVALARERVRDDDLRDTLATAEEKTADVIGLGEEARRIEQAMRSGGTATGTACLRAVLDEIGKDLADRGVRGRVEIDVPDDVGLRANRRLLDGVLGNLIENGLEHNDADDPLVEVVLVDRDPDAGSVTLEIRDDGPGIPDHELAVVEGGEETALEHGSGLGLWFVAWGVEFLGGEITFETGPDGTTAVVSLPDDAAGGGGCVAASRES